MSEFKRKGQASGFEAGEERFADVEQAGTVRPDFSALEAESGVSSGRSSGRIRRTDSATEAQPSPGENPGFDLEDRRARPPELEPLRPAPEKPAKKRYYSPGEVMQKKGCIGCGGMLLTLPLMAVLLGLIVALF